MQEDQVRFLNRLTLSSGVSAEQHSSELGGRQSAGTVVGPDN